MTAKTRGQNKESRDQQSGKPDVPILGFRGEEDELFPDLRLALRILESPEVSDEAIHAKADFYSRLLEGNNFAGYRDLAERLRHSEHEDISTLAALILASFEDIPKSVPEETVTQIFRIGYRIGSMFEKIRILSKQGDRRFSSGVRQQAGASKGGKMRRILSDEDKDRCVARSAELSEQNPHWNNKAIYESLAKEFDCGVRTIERVFQKKDS